jgi:hypothetical protein
LEINFSSIEDLSRLWIKKNLYWNKWSHASHCRYILSNNDGILRSTKCAFVAEKFKLCGKCFALKNYLRARLKTTQTQVQITRPKFRCCSSTKKKKTTKKLKKNDNGSFHSKTTNFSATTSENFYFLTGCCL